MNLLTVAKADAWRIATTRRLWPKRAESQRVNKPLAMLLTLAAGAAMSQDENGRVAAEQAPLEISQTLEERLTTIGRIVHRFRWASSLTDFDG